MSSFGRRRHARNAEQLRRRRADDARRGVEGVLAEQHEIVAAAFELRGKRLGDGEAVGGHRVGLELHGAIGAHAHRLAQRFLHGVGAERVDDRLAAACFSLSCSATSTA